MLDRLRTWLREDAAPQEDDNRKWGLPLWWGTVVVALFTLAISWCNNPADLVAAAATTTTSAAPTSTVPLVAPGTPNLVERMEERADLTFFRSLITTAGIDEVLSEQGPFTFFVPTDDAFAALPDEVRTAVLGDPNIANQLLQTHAAFGPLLAADLVAAGGAQTVIGQQFAVTQSGDAVLIDRAQVLEADLLAANGVIHIIDGVLGLQDAASPNGPQPVSQVLADRSDLSTLVAALGAVEGDLFAADDAGFTVFAPSDAAFDSLPAGSVEVLLATQPKLFELLGYHVVPGTLLSSDLTDGQVLTTATGAELPVTITDGVIAVGDVAISEADIAATNGVVHIVDGVLIPPDYALPTINEALSLEPITFETGSAVITADGIAVLQQAVDFLTANPDVRIGIEGHTDSQGGEASNQALSEARAESVRDYLVEQGIAADRLETAGFGESSPIASNDTADGRAQNRRIEFVIR